MCRIVIKYNNKKVASYKCPTDRLSEGLKYLRYKYPNCVLSIS